MSENEYPVELGGAAPQDEIVYHNAEGEQISASEEAAGPAPKEAAAELDDSNAVYVQGGKQLIAADGGVIVRDLETADETFVPDASEEDILAGGVADEFIANDERTGRMADILRTGKAPAVISRRNDRPRKLRTRNGRIYEK